MTKYYLTKDTATDEVVWQEIDLGGGGFTQEEIADFIGLMVSGNTETNVAVTYDDATEKFNFVVAWPSASDLGLDTESLQDLIGAMVSGNTETNITVTYDDSGGKLNFSVGALAPRVATLTASSNTYTPDADASDLVIMASPAANFTVAAPTGTPVNGQKLTMRIRSDSTGRTPTWNSAYASSGVVTLPTTALPASKTVTIGFIYDTNNSKWVALAADLTGY